MIVRDWFRAWRAAEWPACAHLDKAIHEAVGEYVEPVSGARIELWALDVAPDLVVLMQASLERRRRLHAITYPFWRARGR